MVWVTVFYYSNGKQTVHVSNDMLIGSLPGCRERIHLQPKTAMITAIAILGSLSPGSMCYLTREQGLQTLNELELSPGLALL